MDHLVSLYHRVGSYHFSDFWLVRFYRREKVGNEFLLFVAQEKSCATPYFCCVTAIFQYEQAPQYLNVLERKEKGFLKYMTSLLLQT